jgi:hypothetical protein
MSRNNPSFAASTSAFDAQCVTRKTDAIRSSIPVFEGLVQDHVLLPTSILSGSGGHEGTIVENHGKFCPKPPSTLRIKDSTAPTADHLAMSTCIETFAAIIEDGSFRQQDAVVPVPILSENPNLSGSALEELNRNLSVGQGGNHTAQL